MLVLRNISKSNNTIEADFYPEDGKEYGHIKVDLLTGKYISITLAKGYENSTSPSHARRELIAMANLAELPKERMVMWY